MLRPDSQLPAHFKTGHPFFKTGHVLCRHVCVHVLTKLLNRIQYLLCACCVRACVHACVRACVCVCACVRCVCVTPNDHCFLLLFIQHALKKDPLQLSTMQIRDRICEHNYHYHEKDLHKQD